ncbi:MAG: [NiFe]-hydrogenase assembly chaperone HybE [Phyllobacteriaceae bacterium]|nr:[NiFe]-hydrogenase assembly chaperone HybE [Phyllobacteriaceae bacterium]
MNEASAAPVGPETTAADGAGAAVASRLAALYAAIAERSMRDLPVYNPRLRVEAVGFRRDGDRVVGVLATPWFMNLVVTAASDDAPLAPHPAGASVTHAFAGGEFDFVVGALDGFGRVDGASLFSPMFDFDDPEVVRAVAEAAIAEVVTAPQPETPAPPAPASEAPRLDRRALLFGRRKEEASCR